MPVARPGRRQGSQRLFRHPPNRLIHVSANLPFVNLNHLAKQLHGIVNYGGVLGLCCRLVTTILADRDHCLNSIHDRQITLFMTFANRLQLLGLLLLAVMPACAPVISQDPASDGEATAAPLVWPEPPAQGRIRFVRSVSQARDLGIRPSLWGRVLQAVRGADQVGLLRPTGVAASGETIYVADPGAQALWLLNSASRQFQRIRTAGEHSLVSPVAVAASADGRVYLADSYLARVFVYAPDGAFQQIIGQQVLQRPSGLAYDPQLDRLYVADSAAHCVWVFHGDGARAGVIGERGAGPGQFNFPTHVAVDRQGNLYVNDALGFRIQTFGSDGELGAIFGRHGDGGGDFSASKGVGVDGDGHIYVVDALFDAVRIFDSAGQFLLSFGERGTGRGQFWLPGGLYVDDLNRIYVADLYNQRIQIFQYLDAGADD
jgi:DNA-binding beta-propeller fold protein YncE